MLQGGRAQFVGVGAAILLVAGLSIYWFQHETLTPPWGAMSATAGSLPTPTGYVREHGLPRDGDRCQFNMSGCHLANVSTRFDGPAGRLPDCSDLRSLAEHWTDHGYRFRVDNEGFSMQTWASSPYCTASGNFGPYPVTMSAGPNNDGTPGGGIGVIVGDPGCRNLLDALRLCHS